MKPAKFKLIAITSAFFMLSGCVTNGNQYVWTKASAVNIEQERALDDSQCLATAYKSFQTTSMPNQNCMGTCVNNNRGFSSGFAAGAAARQNKEIGRARDKFYESCMLGKGWQKQPVQ